MLRDFRLAFRTLAKSPGLVTAVVLTLGLGIGANTAVFSITDRVLLRRLPVQDPDALVVLRMPGPQSGHVWSDIDDGAQSFSYPFYDGLRERCADGGVFGGLLARFGISASVSGFGHTERASGELVSGNYFQVLGVRPALGRLFEPADELEPGGRPVAVLSHGYWTRRFGASPDILDQSIVVNGHALTVVGVADARFGGVQIGESTDLFVPITLKARMTPNWDGLRDRKDYWLQMVGRLAPGVSRQQAEAALSSMVAPLLEQDVAVYTGLSAERRERVLAKRMLLVPGGQGRRVLQEYAGPGLLLLASLVALVLLIACANVANLLIARGIARRREIAVRQALGAPRPRLVRELLAESLLLSIAGGAAGLLVAAWSLDGILSMLPADSAYARLDTRLDARLLAFTFAVTLLTGLASGIVPALRATRSNLIADLKEQGAGTGTGASHVRLRRILVVVQIAVTAVLLITAGLTGTSLGRLNGVDLGMKPEGVVAFSVEPQLSAYSPGKTIALCDAIRKDLLALPGVTAASAAEMAVLTDTNEGSNITVEGYTAAAEENVRVLKNKVGPGYLATLGIPLREGRDFAESDAAGGPKVAIINETMARKYFPGRSPIGAQFGFGAGNAVKLDVEIVGVVADSKHATVREEKSPFVFQPYAQNEGMGAATFYVRSTLPPGALIEPARAIVRRHDAALPVFGVKTLTTQLDESLSSDRLLATLATCFALLAALLAAIGLYGVMSYTVTRRTAEIGIRMALGASLRHIRALVLREATTLAAVGLIFGIPAALVVARAARSLLFGVGPHTPTLTAAAALFLVVVTMAAAWLPARRAARIDPMVALRRE